MDLFLCVTGFPPFEEDIYLPSAVVCFLPSLSNPQTMYLHVLHLSEGKSIYLEEQCVETYQVVNYRYFPSCTYHIYKHC